MGSGIEVGMTPADHKAQYLEEVRLFFWYSPSKFSAFQSQKSPSLAEKHRQRAQAAYERYLLSKIGKAS